MELTDRSCVRLITVFSKRFFVLRSPQFQPVIFIDPRNLRVQLPPRFGDVLRPSGCSAWSESHFFRAFLRVESMVNPGIASNQNAPSATLTAVDTGLGCLGLVLALSGEAFDSDRARREYLTRGRVADSDALVRLARAQGLTARPSRSTVKRVQALSLPVIARGRDGAFFVIGRLIETGVL